VRLDERIAEDLARHTELIFGLVGQDTMRLAAFASTAGMRYVAARHETAAVSMAAGYARVTGEVGVAIVSRGPGLSNALSGIVASAKAHASVVVVLGDDPSDTAALGYDPKRIDQNDLLAAAGVTVFRLREVESALLDLESSFVTAADGQTVVVLVPLDVLEADATSARPVPQVATTHSTGAGLSAGRSLIRAAADTIQACSANRTVLVLAGRGASSRAGPSLRRLGGLTGAMMGTTLQAKSLFDNHPRNIGVVGSLGRPDLAQLLASTGVVISAGASLNPFTTLHGRLLGSAELIQIDTDATAFGRYVPAGLALHGDAARVAADLADEIADRHLTTKTSPCRVSSLASSGVTMPAPHAGSQGVDPHLLMRAIDEILPADRAVVVDAGHQLTFACQHLHVASPDAFIFHDAFQCIGIGLSTGIGAACARPSRITAVSVGDGSFMMSSGDLDTAVRHRLPLVLIVMNDEGFGAERHYLDMLGIESETAVFPNPSFAQLARAMGARGITVRELTDLRELSSALADDQSGPIVLDCHIDPTVRGEWLQSNLRRGPA
jgi:thiamine pyrophosphate-dependent acetolactate synthase large subunit-like protein